MKSGWEIKAFGDICDIYDRKRKPISKRDREPGPYPYYGASCIQDYVSGYLFDGRYLLVGEDGAKWGPGEDTAYIAEGKFWVNNHAHIVKAKEGYLDDYLCYYIKALDLNPIVAGAIIPKLTQEKLIALEIPVPSLPEQQRIVDILDQEFAKIDALKANAEKSIQAAKDMFQAALKKELEPKAGWKSRAIGDIADLKGGKRVPKGYKLETKPTGYPYIRVADFNEDGSVDMGDIHFISKVVYDGIKRYIITTDDVYISIAGTIGKSGIIPSELNGANLTENACRLVLKGNINNKYIYYCTTSNQFKEQIAKLTKQAAQPKLALTRLATATISIPSRTEQDRIVKVLSELNERCKAIQSNYQKTLTLCDDLKQALLRKAFNGDL